MAKMREFFEEMSDQWFKSTQTRVSLVRLLEAVYHTGQEDTEDMIKSAPILHAHDGANARLGEVRRLITGNKDNA